MDNFQSGLFFLVFGSPWTMIIFVHLTNSKHNVQQWKSTCALCSYCKLIEPNEKSYFNNKQWWTERNWEFPCCERPHFVLHVNAIELRIWQMRMVIKTDIFEEFFLFYLKKKMQNWVTIVMLSRNNQYHFSFSICGLFIIHVFLLFFICEWVLYWCMWNNMCT